MPNIAQLVQEFSSLSEDALAIATVIGEAPVFGQVSSHASSIATLLAPWDGHYPTTAMAQALGQQQYVEGDEPAIQQAIAASNFPPQLKNQANAFAANLTAAIDDLAHTITLVNLTLQIANIGALLQNQSPAPPSAITSSLNNVDLLAQDPGPVAQGVTSATIALQNWVNGGGQVSGTVQYPSTGGAVFASGTATAGFAPNIGSQVIQSLQLIATQLTNLPASGFTASDTGYVPVASPSLSDAVEQCALLVAAIYNIYGNGALGSTVQPIHQFAATLMAQNLSNTDAITLIQNIQQVVQTLQGVGGASAPYAQWAIQRLLAIVPEIQPMAVAPTSPPSGSGGGGHAIAVPLSFTPVAPVTAQVPPPASPSTLTATSPTTAVASSTSPTVSPTPVATTSAATWVVGGIAVGAVAGLLYYAMSAAPAAYAMENPRRRRRVVERNPAYLIVYDPDAGWFVDIHDRVTGPFRSQREARDWAQRRAA